MSGISVTLWTRVSRKMKHNSDFSHDLEVGQLGERALAQILENSKIEVETDLQASKTGNVFVEYESRNKPSGVATSGADFWCFIISRHQLALISARRIKGLARKYWHRQTLGGDSNTSKGVLVPVNDLISTEGVRNDS